MEMPRLISSECSSVHLPDNALVSVVLPWSTWPIMPMLTSGWAAPSVFPASAFFVATAAPRKVPDKSAKADLQTKVDHVGQGGRPATPRTAGPRRLGLKRPGPSSD